MTHRSRQDRDGRRTGTPVCGKAKFPDTVAMYWRDVGQDGQLLSEVDCQDCIETVKNERVVEDVMET